METKTGNSQIKQQQHRTNKQKKLNKLVPNDDDDDDECGEKADIPTGCV